MQGSAVLDAEQDENHKCFIEKGTKSMKKFNVNDKVRIVYDIDSAMEGVEGVIVWIKHKRSFGENACYLLRIDAERYKKEDVGWNLESSDDCFPASIRERYADNPYYKFWIVNDTQIVHVEDEDTKYHDMHYKACIVEPILVMCATFTSEQFKGFLRGNALKYRLRAGHKEDVKADIDKALRYEHWLKEYEETGEITL